LPLTSGFLARVPVIVRLFPAVPGTGLLTNFLAVIDASSERRSRFMRAAEAQLAPVPGLITSSYSVDGLSLAWAAASRAPTDHLIDEGGATVVWGEALRSSDPRRLSASALRRSRQGGEAGEPLGGFHCLFDYGSERGLTIRPDLLGTFPVYWWSSADVLLVGSSATLFRLHPEFRVRLDPQGLVGILLIHNIVGGRTLLRGVRRLAAGHSLRWRAGEQPREALEHPLPTEDEPLDLPLQAHADGLDRVLSSAVSRHAPPEDAYGLLLSGGRDSRMLAGYLAGQGTEVEALSLGRRGDFDAGLARRVARELGISHRIVEHSEAELPRHAELAARWEHVSNGFSMIQSWGTHSHARALPGRLVNGYIVGQLVGGGHVDWAYDPATATMSFENFFRRVNAWGISPAALGRVLRRDVFAGLVEATIDELRATYESYGAQESRRAWWFDIHHLQRLHVGAHLWRLSFGSWPVLPVLDPVVLSAVSAIPAGALANRAVQDVLLRTRFPTLAAIPLDYGEAPLKITRRGLVEMAAWRARDRALSRRRDARSQLRRYRRLYDLSNPGWLGVRRAAERHRELAYEVFVPEELARILPSPPAPVPLRGGSVLANLGPYLLLGFLIWSGDFLH
jgi:asparagine synthase (glutamine-hydrolysing)